jgi:hypothetical protein
MVFCQFEGLSYLSWRLWPLKLVGILVIWDVWLFNRYKSLPASLAAEADTARKQKWFQFGKKKKRK